MRFLIDECVSPTTVALLRGLGHDVLDIKELERFGTQDFEIYRIACQQKRVIVTTDKGFRMFDPARCGGIIISTIRPNTPVRYEPRLKHLLTTTHLDELTGVLVLLEEKRHRLIKRQPHR
ncbi:DUF5615 family PIN-like protein [Candidatus Methylomirabilis limnetica]|uniref:DUF5615 family PIN-like protein n=1 Tax=Candidatus Methylomirabilis limnetica TaxID=2033718 RepID=UPI000D1E83C6